MQCTCIVPIYSEVPTKHLNKQICQYSQVPTPPPQDAAPVQQSLTRARSRRVIVVGLCVCVCVSVCVCVFSLIFVFTEFLRVLKTSLVS